MKYAIIKVINGNFSVHAEGYADIGQAKVAFHGLCQALWNASDVYNAFVMIADEQLDAAEGYKEYIHHDIVPTVPVEEPVEEPTE